VVIDRFKPLRTGSVPHEPDADEPEPVKELALV